MVAISPITISPVIAIIRAMTVERRRRRHRARRTRMRQNRTRGAGLRRSRLWWAGLRWARLRRGRSRALPRRRRGTPIARKGYFRAERAERERYQHQHCKKFSNYLHIHNPPYRDFTSALYIHIGFLPHWHIKNMRIAESAFTTQNSPATKNFTGGYSK